MKHNSEIFKEIYDEYSDAIFRFCLVKVSNREQALDITQETFLRVWKEIQNKEEINNPRAFVFTLARNLIIDWYRKKKSLSLDSMLEGETSYDVKDEKNINSETSAEGRFLLNKIDMLHETYREPVYLRFVEDMSPGEIGEILGINANAASVRITRGLEELRKITGYNTEG